MVTKLLVAVQEVVEKAVDAGASAALLSEITAAYRRVRAGLGPHHGPAKWGAFPADPYSHSPAHLGAQQPGMTGQVKEEILTRLAELAVRFDAGVVRFDPTLLDPAELHATATTWTLPSAGPGGTPRTVPLPAGALAFTLCGVPVVLRTVSSEPAVHVTSADGRTRSTKGLALDRETSARLFARSGDVARLEVDLVLDRATGPEARR